MFWTDFTSRPAAAALNSWLAGAPASLNHDHELIFAVPQMNLDVLEQKLQQVSDPRSDVYGHHLSFKEVGALIRNAPSFNTVSAWLASSGAQCRATPHGEYLHCTAPVSLWNTLLNTQFRHFSHASHAGTPVVRALNVSVPSAMAPHLAAIHLASAFGLPVRASSCAPPRRVASGDPFCDTHPCATVPTLQNVYNTCGARPNKSAALGPGFNAAGRGYPDVALIGHLFRGRRRQHQGRDLGVDAGDGRHRRARQRQAARGRQAAGRLRQPGAVRMGRQQHLPRRHQRRQQLLRGRLGPATHVLP